MTISEDELRDAIYVVRKACEYMHETTLNVPHALRHTAVHEKLYALLLKLENKDK